MTPKKRIAILGSTGSIGTQALDVISQHSDLFEVELLTAHNNVSLLIEQAIKFEPNTVIISNTDHYTTLKESLANYPIKVYSGSKALSESVTYPSVDICLNGLVGFSGLLPTIEAIKANKVVALANKEVLVVAGELISKLMMSSKGSIIPVDSEHSAIFQCLLGEVSPPKRLILTASGGPFLNFTEYDLKNVSIEQALKHPRWSMGQKISIDSASMINKVLEIIEAKWLFDIDGKNIDVVIHPSSIVHSMITFEDGAVKAQLGNPDMRQPISFALSYPKRVSLNTKPLDFTTLQNLQFMPPNSIQTRALNLAYQTLNIGKNAPCVLNAANEIVVQAFLNGQIAFNQIIQIIEKVLSLSNFHQIQSIDDLIETDLSVRQETLQILHSI